MGTAKYLIIPRSRAHLGLAFGLRLGKIAGDSAAITGILDRLIHNSRARVIREIGMAANAAFASRCMEANEQRAQGSAYPREMARVAQLGEDLLCTRKPSLKAFHPLISVFNVSNNFGRIFLPEVLNK